MTWKSYAAVSGAGLLATYLVSTPPGGMPERAGVSRAPVAARRAPPAVDIAAEASRLRARVPADVRYEEPSRNPFRFGARHATRPPEPVEAPTVPEPALAAPVPQPPPIRLSGIATRLVDGTRQRSAIVITSTGILTVGEGDAIGADYRVRRIDDDAVELIAADGSSRRLLLRP